MHGSCATRWMTRTYMRRRLTGMVALLVGAAPLAQTHGVTTSGCQKQPSQSVPAARSQ